MNLRERCEDLENGILDKCISGDSFSWKSERVIEMLESFAREIRNETLEEAALTCEQKLSRIGYKGVVEPDIRELKTTAPEAKEPSDE